MAESKPLPPTHDHCKSCIFLRCTHKFCDVCPVMDCDNSCGLRFHGCKLTEHLKICQKADVECINATNGCTYRTSKNNLAQHLQSCPASVVKCAGCGKFYRRDEYTQHYRNFHDDIPSMSEWPWVSTCPLAWYGCTFKYRCFEPVDENDQVIKIPTNLREKFGVMSIATDINETECLEIALQNPLCDVLVQSCMDGAIEKHIKSLPYEIWYKIAGYLDAASLYSLSLVNKALREVCLRFTRSRGLVSWQWERHEDMCDVVTWKPGNTKWLFSQSFPAIPNWRLTPTYLTDHLQVCPYNDVIHNDRPVALPHKTSEVVFYNIGRNNFSSYRCEPQSGMLEYWMKHDAKNE